MSKFYRAVRPELTFSQNWEGRFYELCLAVPLRSQEMACLRSIMSGFLSAESGNLFSNRY
jgi:hypothetical protein